MVRPKMPEEERKRQVTIRLKPEHIQELLKDGTMQQVLERLVMDYLRKKGG